MPALLYLYLLSIVALAQVLLALEVTPGSSCSTFCLDFEKGNGFDPLASTTNTSDIICKDAGFSSSDVGIKFKNCLECLQKSEKVNGTESDLKWFIYNLRYTVSTCLFSVPAAVENAHVDSPCVIDYACNTLKGPITGDDLKSESTTAFDYCSADDDSFMGSHLNPCISCLRSSGDQVYLANFMTALEVGCQQAPKDGDLLHLSGTVFSKTPVNATTPEEDIRKKPEGAGAPTMTTGTIVGIVIGVCLFLFGGLGVFFVHRRQKNKQKHNEKSSESPDPIFPANMAMSQSLRSYGSEQSFQSNKTGMTMGEYYDKLEEAVQIGGRRTYNYDPRVASRGPHGALPTHEAYLPRTMSKNGNSRRILDISTLPATPQIHRRSQSHPGDSFALRIFGNTTTNPDIPPPPARQLSGVIPKPPTVPPPARQSKVPAISLPTFNIMKAPKQYTPPSLATSTSNERLLPPMSFQSTMSSSQTSFNAPPGGASFGLQMPPSRPLKESVSDMSMRSGKSELYGF